MTIYNNIYPNRQLEDLLAKVYKDVVRFAQEATTYCLSSHGQSCDEKAFSMRAPLLTGCGLERLVHTLGKPLRFQEIESGMRDHLQDVRLRCDALLAENVAKILVQNRDFKSQILELQHEIEGKLRILAVHQT